MGLKLRSRGTNDCAPNVPKFCQLRESSGSHLIPNSNSGSSRSSATALPPQTVDSFVTGSSVLTRYGLNLRREICCVSGGSFVGPLVRSLVVDEFRLVFADRIRHGVNIDCRLTAYSRVWCVFWRTFLAEPRLLWLVSRAEFSLCWRVTPTLLESYAEPS